MNPDENQRRFQLLALPHLGAAYNLARWLTRNDHDAEDVVQEAFLRALRYFGGFRGDNARAWLLQIVRNTCFTWMKENRPVEVMPFDDAADLIDETPAPASDEPHTAALRNADRILLNEAIASLPMHYREVLVLRELEDCSYNDIARVVDVPLGTVMSRLARARRLVRQALVERPPQRTKPTLQSVPRG